MANVKISQLNAASALTGSEVVPVVQGGTTKKVTTQAIAALAGGSGGGLGTFNVTADGVLGSSIQLSYSLSASVPSSLNNTTYSAPIQPSLQGLNWYASSGGGYGYGYGGGGDVTTAENISFDNVVSTQNVQVNGGNIVKSFSFPELTSCSYFSISGSSSLTSINVPKLASLNGGSIVFDWCTSLTNPYFPVLTGSVSLQWNSPVGFTSLTSAMFPALTKFNVPNIYNGLISINMPAITDYTQFNVGSVTTIQEFILPGLTYSSSAYLNFANKSSLTTVVLGTLGTFKEWGGQYSWRYIDLGGCSLTEASVNNVLINLASLDGTNGTTIANNGTLYLQGGSNAAPTGDALTAVNTLVSRGWNVYHN